MPERVGELYAFIFRESEFDGLGRLIKEVIAYPDETGIGGSARDFTYDAMGRKIAESTWEDFERETDFEYDRFGRVTKIISVDTSLAPTVVTYRGDRRVDRSDKVATRAAEADEHRVCFREEYDAFGRLRSVNEDRASDGSGTCQNQAVVGLLTTYDDAESDRLTSVCAMGTGSSCVQQRFFTYDNRGFLVAEQHPEIGPVGNALIIYRYDASGNVLKKDVSGSDDFSLRYSYDGANRLLAIDEVTTSGPPEVTRPLKTFQYARSNDGDDKRAGKLTLAKRVNWVDIVGPLDGATGILPVTVSQAYRYEGLDGRISTRQTRYNLDIAHYAWETGYEYDALGNTSRIHYPRCQHNQCAGTDPERSVDYLYTRGFLSEVSGYATDFHYKLGGMLHEVHHTNGVTETIDHSPSNLQRPHRISTTGVFGGNDWDSGTYLYDSSGNVKQIGTQTYTYDRMNRLTEGKVDIEGVLKTQSLSYDAFGNILSLATDGTALATPVSNATNRLTNGTYDAGGNLTNITLEGESYQYTYDPLNMMKHLQSTTDQARIFIYDADDERILTFDCVGGCATQEAQITATIRGLDNQVLRTYKLVFGEDWEWQSDTIYREGLLLASVEPTPGGGEETVHYHLDHLGTPRQITSGRPFPCSIRSSGNTPAGAWRTPCSGEAAHSILKM